MRFPRIPKRERTQLHLKPDGGMNGNPYPDLLLDGPIYASGTATTTKPRILVEVKGATSNTWNTSGTPIGVNAPAAFGGNLLDLQVNGTSYFKIDAPASSARITCFNNGNHDLGGGSVQCANFNSRGTNNGTALMLANFSSAGTMLTLSTGTFSNTSGTTVACKLGPTYNQASGTAVNTDFLINRTQTAVGSGAQLLIDAQVSTISQFSVGTQGNITLADGANIITGTATGLKLGTGTTQKIGLYGVSPVAQQVLATGAGATVDNVITMLQALGACKQS